MKKTKFILMLIASVVLGACSTPHDISYFQDMDNGDSYSISNDMEIRLQPNDKLSIVVHSRDNQLSQMFNVPVISQRVGYTNYSNSQQLSVYTVDNNGNIDFPVIGELKISGLNRGEVASLIKTKILQQDLLKDPVVIVEFDNMTFDVLGEVNKAGRYVINRDRITVLDAIAMAGDLTIQGDRKHIKVLRNQNGARTTYTIDLTRGNKVMSSPGYYLQQNDIVYIDPNDYRKRQTTVNGNNIRSSSFWISLASLLTSVAVLVLK